ncbi:hypothetical protein SteCoe_15162 [Stentor coeruleus]|uniref:Uncharacterized protein n=1 Tax=Stentor coeruleus TaxID=5963 RepID=A0A1R2C4A1_9CILI|nr:hypothetical protein SteCoe_15162 [Stentor coeruleus]
MQDRFIEKLPKYDFSPANSQNKHLQSEVRMLEERLKNLEYLKLTYERSSREKTIEIDSLTRELAETKAQLYDKSCIIEDMGRQHASNEAMLLRVIEELRTNKSLLEQELSDKNSNLNSLEKSLQEQYDQSLKLIDENQQLREKIQERENLHSQYVNELEGRLEKITDSQKTTEYRVNSLLRKKSPNCKNPKLKRDYSMKVTLIGKKDNGLNKSLKKVNRTKNGELEGRLMNSEKKLKEIESALVSMSQNSYASPIVCNNMIKARSNSQSLRTGLQRY